MSPCQARSEVLGERKRGAEVVISESDEFPADEISMETDALEDELSVILGGKRAQALVGGKTSGGERLLTCVTLPRAWRAPPLLL